MQLRSARRPRSFGDDYEVSSVAHATKRTRPLATDVVDVRAAASCAVRIVDRRIGGDHGIDRDESAAAPIFPRNTNLPFLEVSLWCFHWLGWTNLSCCGVKDLHIFHSSSP